MSVMLALDSPDMDHARGVLPALAPHLSHVKIGHVLLPRAGFVALRELIGGLPLFLDLKFHDIPATVERAIHAYAEAFPTLACFTLHGVGGEAMIRAAVAAGAAVGAQPLAVSGLSSEVHGEDALLSAVDRLISLGITGIICPPPMIAAVRARFGPDLRLVVPGIRNGADAHDHAETLSAAEARARGANDVVVGRPILSAEDPLGSLKTYLA